MVVGFLTILCFNSPKLRNWRWSQIATTSETSSFRPTSYAFTEHGTIMAANVLNSERAVEASVQVVRAFLKLRQMLASNAELARELKQLESKYDRQFRVVFDAIHQLMTPPPLKHKPIGFRPKTLKK